MGGEDHFRASLGEIFNGRDGTPEPVVFTDLPVLDGHVEVNPDEDTSPCIATVRQIRNDHFHESAILSSQLPHINNVGLILWPKYSFWPGTQQLRFRQFFFPGTFPTLLALAFEQWERHRSITSNN
jgi:hypothetical protein